MISMRRRTRIVSSLAMLCLAFGSPVLGQDVHWSESLALTYDNGSGGTIPYRLFVPPDYDAERAYPLVVFLHGAGESGTNNTSQVAVHIDNLINATQSPQYTSFLVAPQTQSGWGSSLSVSLVQGILTEIEENYSIDAARLYITGLSMGGFGTFDQLYHYPERFAAAAPLSGGVSAGFADEVAAVIKDVPIWVQHGAADSVVSVSLSQNIVNALLDIGASPLYTEYPTMGHNIWTYVYGDRDNTLYPWMFSQSLDGLLLEPMLLGLQSPPDFNGDSRVDLRDLTSFIEHWGQDEPPFDMVPVPAGDGIVDELDLEALMHFWLQDVNDPTLVTHWALDETAGDVASDSAGDSDAILAGDPVWNDAGGMVNGALEFDGVDDHILTASVLNPAHGPLSVLAWIKGGAPGQAIFSQQQGAAWLGIDASHGALQTELKPTRGGSALVSDVVVTDGQWHRVAFTWDESARRLYVDDILVAEDVPASIPGYAGGMYIGCGANKTPGTFFSGLIDDVRIYNRVIKP